MTVDEIAIPKDEAMQAFQAYRGAVRADRAGVKSVWQKEDAALAKAYKAASKGQRLIALTEAFKLAGVKRFAGVGYALPALAICPSDASVCHLTVEENGAVEFSDRNTWGRIPQARLRKIPEGVLPRPVLTTGTWWQQTRAFSTIVPLVPPQYRPKHDIATYHTLWEVEQWKMEPPVDPMLLRHLGGDLYVVLASWDLSPLERAVLRQARRA